MSRVPPAPTCLAGFFYDQLDSAVTTGLTTISCFESLIRLFLHLKSQAFSDKSKHWILNHEHCQHLTSVKTLFSLFYPHFTHAADSVNRRHRAGSQLKMLSSTEFTHITLTLTVTACYRVSSCYVFVWEDETVRSNPELAETQQFTWRLGSYRNNWGLSSNSWTH